TEGGADPIIEDLLDSYKNASNNFTFHMVDPVKDRDLAERFKVTELPTLHIQYGEQSSTVTRDISEETITNGLIKATATTKKVVCFLDGHGEPDPENKEARGFGALQDALRNENYDTRKVLLATEAKVPDECSILVVTATDRPLFDHELDQLREYLKAGRSAQADAAGKPGVSAIEIVKSSPSAWAESDVEGVFKRGEAAQGDADVKGPVSLSVAVTGKHKEMGFGKEGETKLVVVGDADFANNQFFNQLFNRDLV